MHLFVSYYGYLKMAERNTSTEYNLDENSDSEGYRSEDIGDNESILPDSDPNSLDIEVSSVGSSEVSSDHTDFGDEWDDNGPNTVIDATVAAIINTPNWTTNFTEITIEPFTQDSGSSLPENCNVSVVTALDFPNLLFRPEIFNDIKDHTNNYVIHIVVAQYTSYNNVTIDDELQNDGVMN